jgi:hypothetical protein
MLEEEYEDGLGDNIEFGLAISGEGKVLMIVRTNFETGTMEFRVNEYWVPITPDMDVPILDENALTRVTGDAVAIWDRVEEDPKEKDFEEVILDK